MSGGFLPALGFCAVPCHSSPDRPEFLALSPQVRHILSSGPPKGECGRARRAWASGPSTQCLPAPTSRELPLSLPLLYQVYFTSNPHPVKTGKGAREGLRRPHSESQHYRRMLRVGGDQGLQAQFPKCGYLQPGFLGLAETGPPLPPLCQQRTEGSLPCLKSSMGAFR